MNHWQGAIGIALTSTLGFGSVTTALAQSTPLELAQMQDLTGQCRQVNQRVAVYAARGSDEIITTLERGTEVIIDEPMPLAGRISIKLPTNGFVPTGVLANCNVVLPDTPTVGAICINHRVDPLAGLPIHISPSTQSQVRDRLFPEERITIMGNPILDNMTGIEWLNISYPFEGWIENGNPNTRSFNTTPCSELGL